ncbi:DUF4179 domain-containing protein [Bacillus sp. FJAT-29814]|uniref:DUF4179 domain-containing protein n=1 Tax=Bacillus sp. FJAT-29814 TaxID=1729688 RepID=UPI00083586F3|nr:DUF4179 domain-containing protein [Bacillus sp. FJAT-29814]
MFDKEEVKLTEYKKSIDDADIPLQLLDQALTAGYQMAKLEKRRKSRHRKWLVSIMTAAILLISFFTSIRLSPVFAEYVTKIPGMEKVVELIRGDKGKMLALENDYYEKIGVSQEINGMTFTIDGAIADRDGLALFYSIKTKEKQTELFTKNVKLKSLDGKNLDIGSASFGNPPYSETGETSFSEYFEFHFQTPLEARKFELQVSVESGALKEDFIMPFQLNKDVPAAKTYKLNKTVTIQGQKITFIDAKVYPLRAAIHVKMDPQNSKRILNFEDLRLVDENGEAWNKINNGIISSQISPDEAIVYLQSNYFKQPKELYLVLNKLQAVNKDEVFVVVDTEKQEILKQPKENYFSELRVEQDAIYFHFKPGKEFNYFLFTRKMDGNGEEIASEWGSSQSGFENGTMEIGVNIPSPQNQINPISLELVYFPSWIKGDYKLRIK